MYPSIYYAVKDLFGFDIPGLKMIQSFGFFVAMAFLAAAYFLTKELKRKEQEGLLRSGTVKVLRGKKATSSELALSGFVGFILGYKVLYILLNFTAFSENTQGYLLSTEGSIIGGLIGAALAAFMKYWETKKEVKKSGLTAPTLLQEPLHPYQHVGNLTLLAAFTGIIGAKIFHNLENWDEFVADPIDALLSFSGLTMYGGLICASIACIWYGRKHNIPTPHLIDATAPSLMLGYGVGRIGCHISGDGDWGINNLHPKPNWLSWAPDWMWAYDYPHNVLTEGVPLENCGQPKFCAHLSPAVFPTPFYEAVICIALFFVLWKIRKRITTPGVLFCVYLILNGFERFFIEKIRVNTLYHVNGFGFTQAELISTILFFLGVIGVFYFKRLEKNKTVEKVV
jgi:phosphatidylglycerol:prolipoprotein diacylglycerol transferase